MVNVATGEELKSVEYLSEWDEWGEIFEWVEYSSGWNIQVSLII